MKNIHTCPSKSIKMLGDYWTLSIINVLQNGEKRFCEIERLLTGVNPTTLTNRLKKLETVELLERHEETVDKLSVTYALTKKGKAVLPIIREISIFSGRYA